MNKELEKKLMEKYPTIFQEMYGNPKETCMAWGIECADGWYNIIETLCQLITRRINYTKSKWHEGEEAPEVVAQQIKEKFGGLRFYYRGGDDITDAYVSFAEAMSYKTCECCGNVGKPTKGGWITTLCEDCNKSE
jgi:hypothetical protein